jgi:hypothetical protein
MKILQPSELSKTAQKALFSSIQFHEGTLPWYKRANFRPDTLFQRANSRPDTLFQWTVQSPAAAKFQSWFDGRG